MEIKATHRRASKLAKCIQMRYRRVLIIHFHFICVAFAGWQSKMRFRFFYETNLSVAVCMWMARLLSKSISFASCSGAIYGWKCAQHKHSNSMLSDEPLKDIYDRYFLSFLIWLSRVPCYRESPGTDYDLCRVICWLIFPFSWSEWPHRFVYRIGVSGCV